MGTQEIIASLIPLVKLAWAEDVGSGDISYQLTSGKLAEATITARQAAIYCGSIWVDALQKSDLCSFKTLDQKQDGEEVKPGQTVLRILGKLNDLLTLERTLLNGIQTLSATATQTQQLVKLVKNYPCNILDTRKTIPGWRKAQKYAVKIAGGMNHRFGLYDAIMLKENHQCDQLTLIQQINIATQQSPNIPIIVEVESLQSFKFASSLKPQLQQILLDNFSINDLKQAVSFKKSNQINIALEASGNISKHNIQQIASCEVDFISIGSITKNIKAIDLSMQIQLC